MHLKILNEDNNNLSAFQKFTDYFYSPKVKRLVAYFDYIPDETPNETLQRASRLITTELSKEDSEIKIDDLVPFNYSGANLRVHSYDIDNFGKYDKALGNLDPNPNENTRETVTPGSNKIEALYKDNNDKYFDVSKAGIAGMALGLGIYGIYRLYKAITSKDDINENDIIEAKIADQNKSID